MIDLVNCITTKEASTELRIHQDTLALWRMKGKGPAFIKHGKFVYYEKSEIAKYKEKHMRKYASTAQAKVGQKEGKK